MKSTLSKRLVEARTKKSLLKNVYQNYLVYRSVRLAALKMEKDLPP